MLVSKKAIAVGLMSAVLVFSGFVANADEQKFALKKKSILGIRFHENNCFEVSDHYFQERIGLTEHELISLIGLPELSLGDYWSYVNFFDGKTKHCKITYHFAMKGKIKEVKEVFVTTNN